MIALHRPSHAFGIGYSLWLRGRGPLAVAWLLVLALASAAQSVAAFRLPLALGGGIQIGAPVIVLAVPLVVVPVIALLNVFTYGPVDVSSKASSFPMHARLLPLSTRALVGWPMLYAALTIASLWAVLLVCVLRPLGITTSIVWPTTIVVACTLWAQAVAWIPLPVRFVRVPLFFGFVGIPLLFATIDPRGGDHFWTFEIAMVLWAAAAYLFATIGLSRARTGETEAALRSPSLAAPSSQSQVAMAAPFPTRGAARRWYERRRTLSFFSKVFALTPLPLIALCLLAIRFPTSTFAFRMGGGGMPVSSMWAEMYVILVPGLASATMGGYVGRFDHGQKPGLASFFALRPISTARLVADKLLSAGHTAAILFASGAIVAVFALWAYGANAPPLAQARVDHLFTSGGVVDLLLLAFVFALLLWRNLAVDLWTTMTGRLWPSRVVAIYAGFTVAALPVTMLWFMQHPDARHALVVSFPWLARLVVVAKLVAAAEIARRLVQRGLVAVRVVAVAAAAWCIVTAVLIGIASRFVEVSVTVACIVATVVPMARIGLAPLVLAKNRHG